MGDIKGKKTARTNKITGRDELHEVDVIQKDDGTNRMLVDAQTTPVPLGQLFTVNLENGGSADLTINGGGGTDFELPLINEDRIVSSVVIYGRDSGIKFGKFLGNNSPLNNGLVLEVKSEDEVFTFLPVKTTDDFRNKFAVSPIDFVVDFASGEDAFTATFIPAAPFYVRKQTDFTSPDYIRLVVQDNLGGISYLECLVRGAID